MLRILVLCARDWQHPRAGGVERYVYEVFRRIAGEGNYVAWLCQNHGGIPFVGRQPETLEQVDGIQIARLGHRALYRAMTGLFFSRMTKPGSVLRQFDVVIDCVTGRPFPVAKYTATPVVPIVFRLSPGLYASNDAPGPVIAPTELAGLELRSAGVPRRHIVRAPFGAGPTADEAPVTGDDTPSIAAFVNTTQPFAKAMARLARRDSRPSAVVYGPVRRPGGRIQLRAPGSVTEFPASGMDLPRIAYCGEGCEWRALDFAGAGIPVLCPDTDLGREFVRHGETGLLHRSRDAADLAERLQSLLRDETLRHRLGRQAMAESHETTWDRSASLVLAAIENLCHSGSETLSPVPSI